MLAIDPTPSRLNDLSDKKALAQLRVPDLRKAWRIDRADGLSAAAVHELNALVTGSERFRDVPACRSTEPIRILPVGAEMGLLQLLPDQVSGRAGRSQISQVKFDRQRLHNRRRSGGSLFATSLQIQ